MFSWLHTCSKHRSSGLRRTRCKGGRTAVWNSLGDASTGMSKDSHADNDGIQAAADSTQHWLQQLSLCLAIPVQEAGLHSGIGPC